MGIFFSEGGTYWRTYLCIREPKCGRPVAKEVENFLPPISVEKNCRPNFCYRMDPMDEEMVVVAG